MNFKNWKTTLFACITVFFGFVALHPGYFNPVMADIASYIALGGLAAFGLSAKDNDVTGGTKTQPTVVNIPTEIEK